MHGIEIFESCETVISVYWVPFCLHMELTVAPLVAGTSSNANPVLLKMKIANIPTAKCEPNIVAEI